MDSSPPATHPESAVASVASTSSKPVPPPGNAESNSVTSVTVAEPEAAEAETSSWWR